MGQASSLLLKPSFPAAAQTIKPEFAALFIASNSGSPSLFPPGEPRERFTDVQPSFNAWSIAAIISVSLAPSPVSGNTLYAIRFASGATPFTFPFPVAIPATAVPWPNAGGSIGSGSSFAKS